ncbi:hypothetical protein [Pseudomonas putida]|uniref:Uncharacterized protein n=1 Tax=Pseudomonas putida TaxID=303 RepID=A0A6S5TN37_PSEPU|nr:hypothetical protein [Pseudomonas putida]BBT40887.1 hypothetical protein WP8W18C01_32280 [Pseudomonas putida]
MNSSYFNISSATLENKEPVQINLHRKSDRQMENWYAACSDDEVYLLTEAEYQGLQRELSKSSGHARIDHKRITGFSLPNEQGIVPA